MVIESKDEAKQISYYDSRSCWGKNANKDEILESRDRPYSNNFLTLFLENVMRIHVPRQMMDYGEK